MTELCCPPSIVERIYRAQLLLCLKLRVSPILHRTASTRIPRNQAGFSLAHSIEPCQTGPKTLPLPETSVFLGDYQECRSRRQRLSGQASSHAKGGRL